jgi:hypothetical protein
MAEKRRVTIAEAKRLTALYHPAKGTRICSL